MACGSANRKVLLSETDLKARGVQDILTTCTDNLNEFTDTIRTVFPKSSTQVCVVHQIRNTCKYVVYKDKKEFTADMKNIYNAPNKEVAATELDNLKKEMGRKVSLCHTFMEKQLG